MQKNIKPISWMTYQMNKICIIGIRATGKTTLAKALSDHFHIPAYYTDSFWWRPHWQVADETEVEKQVSHILETDSWIIEGYIEPFGTEKIHKADIIIYLDYSPLTVLFQGFKRFIQHRKTPRSELPEGCVEKMTWEDFLVLLFRKERNEIEEVLQKSNPTKLLRFRNTKALSSWLEQLR